MIAHARESAPEEACGLLAGVAGVPGRVIRCRNAHVLPTSRFLIDPRDQLRAFSAMDERGEDLVAIYHSHPASQPFPSPTDRDEASYPDAVHVLVSLRAAEPEVRAFQILASGAVRELRIA